MSSLTEVEIVELFDRLFPQGFTGADVCAELAIADWKESPLSSAFHPSLQRVWEEAVRIHRNLAALRASRNQTSATPEPTLEQIQRDYVEPPWEPVRELRELIGRCLWDVFSDNHEALAPDGRVADTGSFRGSGGFIADYLNAQLATNQYDYMDFYMGAMLVAGRTDLRPVYRLIFQRLHAVGGDWRYHFPRLLAVDLRPLRAGAPEWAGYSPADAFAQETELAHLQQSLADAHRESVARARQLPPPATVQAYRDIFGRWPSGWPPTVESDTAADEE